LFKSPHIAIFKPLQLQCGGGIGLQASLAYMPPHQKQRFAISSLRAVTTHLSKSGKAVETEERSGAEIGFQSKITRSLNMKLINISEMKREISMKGKVWGLSSIFLLFSGNAAAGVPEGPFSHNYDIGTLTSTHMKTYLVGRLIYLHIVTHSILTPRQRSMRAW
jgi:hypothetical protein